MLHLVIESSQLNCESRNWPVPVLALLVISGCQGIIGGCQRLPESVGPNQEILVLVDPTDWEVLETPLREAFEKVLLTPQEEKVFRLQRGELDDFEVQKHKLRKNLLVAPSSVRKSTRLFTPATQRSSGKKTCGPGNRSSSL